MKKRSLTINISDRALYGIIGIFILLLVGGVAYAYGGVNPSVMGHSAGEIEVKVAGEIITLQEFVNDGASGIGIDEASCKWMPSGCGDQVCESGYVAVGMRADCQGNSFCEPCYGYDNADLEAHAVKCCKLN